MRLAIADPPYLGRADRWYGNGVGYGHGKGKPDFHPEAARWDEPATHHELMCSLMDEFDGFALAGNTESLPVYLVAAGNRFSQRGNVRIGSWHRPGAVPSGSRILQSWEPVVFCIPESRKGHGSGMSVSDVHTAPPVRDFLGGKPASWTRWVLAVLGYDPATDEVCDIFHGSGAVADAADGMLI